MANVIFNRIYPHLKVDFGGTFRTFPSFDRRPCPRFPIERRTWNDYRKRNCVTMC